MAKSLAKSARRARSEPQHRKLNVIDTEQYTRTKRKFVLSLPRNTAQETYIAALNEPGNHIVIAVGPAGTGKTKLATEYAISQLRKGEIDKIVITRPVMPLDDRDIGYLKGSLREKTEPWMMPILDVFWECYSRFEVDEMIEEGTLEMVPLSYIRGRTFKNAIVICDEAQGTTPTSMKAVLTRIGDGSKMIITGDTNQSDHGDKNGLTDFLQRYYEIPGVSVVRFKRCHSVRHSVISGILGLYGED